jgi:hypothetical protein
MKKYIYQIYYDDETKNKLLPGLIPLDNTKNDRPDWFEFYIILNFLRNNTLEDNAWYGFLSPKFYNKTFCTPDLINHALDKYGEEANVALPPYCRDLLSYFLNPFEQGEIYHPGLLNETQIFINKIGLKFDLKNLVTDTSCSIFSNYTIAKKEFWLKWKFIAEEYFSYVEGDIKNQNLTQYKTKINSVPMKAFIQERFATLVLSSGNFRTLQIMQNLKHPISRHFIDNFQTRTMLQTCDLMKLKYRENLDEKYLEMYWMIRKAIKFSKAPFSSTIQSFNKPLPDIYLNKNLI